jgi:protein-tyrosine kinase
MAKFRDSVLRPLPPAAAAGSLRHRVAERESESRIGTPSQINGQTNGKHASGRHIGEILAEARKLSPRKVDKIVARQIEKGERFGESAIALGYASADDVLTALAQQFNYPVATPQQRKRLPELVALNEPFSAQTEALRAIRSWVMQRVFGEAQQTRRALAVVSPNSGDGKTYFAANLSITLAQLGGRTLLVDADLRGPRQHEMFGLPNQHGLSGILSGRTEKRVVQQVPTVAGLFVLPVGATPPNPLELIERPTFGLLIRELVSKFDHVVVDTSAGEYGADASVISARCGAALVIARKDASRVSELNALSIALSRSTATVAGVIVNEY